MTKAKFILALLCVCLIVKTTNAQITDNQNTKKQDSLKALKVKELLSLKTTIEQNERDLLKKDIKALNKKFQKGEITNEQLQILKKESAKKRALNIENRLSIIENSIELLKRNPYNEDSEKKISAFGVNFGRVGINVKTNKKPVRYDIGTSSGLVLATGFNTTIIDGESLSDSPYKIGGSGFMELGWNWKTRLLKHSNFVRLNYGLSLQWNKLEIRDDQFFVQDGNTTTLESFSVNLRKSKFRTTNLVIPVYLEFGPSHKIEKPDRIRYINNKKFKIGLGGYAGLNIGTLQKLKYRENGDRVKQKTKQSFNTSDFIYGIGGYIGAGVTSLYVKYDLNTLFKDQVIDQNNISLGIRFDFD